MSQDQASAPASSIITRTPISALALTGVFLKIGATAFGDTGPVLASIERELVDARGVLTQDDLTAALTYTKPLPGSTVVQLVAYLAYLVGGWGISALCTIAFILPAALAMIAFAAGYVAVAALPGLRPLMTGITAATVGLLLASTYRLGKRNITGPLTVALALAAFIMGAVFNVNAALLVLAGGLLGIPLFSKTDIGKGK